MLEQISQLVRQYGQQSVVDNPEIPNEHNNEIMAEATTTITSGFQNILSGGGLQNIISLFNQGGNQGPGSNQGGIAGLLKNPMVTMMIGHLIGKLTSKYNMSPAQASQVSNNLVPNVLNDMIGRTASADPAHAAFDLNSLINSLTGGGAAPSAGGTGGFNFQNLLNEFNGGSQPGTGNGFDLQDIISQVTQQAQQNKANETQNAGGGLGDLIKGFFR